MGMVKEWHEELVNRMHGGDIEAAKILRALGSEEGLRGASAVLDACADYIACGFSIVAISPAEKRPWFPWKPLQTQVASAATIWQWYDDVPDAGVAFVLGPISRLFLIDVDGKASHDALRAHIGSIPVTPTVRSGSGEPYRYHLLFSHPAVDTSAKYTPWHPKLEFRGQGGLAVAPPSSHQSGNQYRWFNGRSLDDVPLAEVPEPVLAALGSRQQSRSQRKQRATSTQVVTWSTETSGHPLLSRATRRFLAGVYANSKGHWNTRLFRAACDMAGCGYPQEDAESLLLEGAAPWDAEEQEKALRTIQSAYSEPRRPAKSRLIV